MTPAIGLQLWTLREECQRDFPAALEGIARAGYRCIEPYDFYGMRAQELKRILDSLGLRVISSHVPIDLLEGDLSRVMDDHDSLECKMLVCPWLEEARRRAPEDFDRVGESLDGIGARLRARGFTLSYHNHEFEFTQAKDPDGLQRILRRAAPENLGAQLDVYWASFAGHDPVAYMRGLGARLHSVHLKDGYPAKGTFTPVGSGEIDMRAVAKAGTELGARAFIVEQDEHEGDQFESIARSLEFLERIANGE